MCRYFDTSHISQTLFLRAARSQPAAAEVNAVPGKLKPGSGESVCLLLNTMYREVPPTFCRLGRLGVVVMVVLVAMVVVVVLVLVVVVVAAAFHHLQL